VENSGAVSVLCMNDTDQVFLFCGMKGGISSCAEQHVYGILRIHAAVMSGYATVAIFAVIQNHVPPALQ